MPQTDCVTCLFSPIKRSFSAQRWVQYLPVEIRDDILQQQNQRQDDHSDAKIWSDTFGHQQSDNHFNTELIDSRPCLYLKFHQFHWILTITAQLQFVIVHSKLSWAVLEKVLWCLWIYLCLCFCCLLRHAVWFFSLQKWHLGLEEHLSAFPHEHTT